MGEAGPGAQRVKICGLTRREDVLAAEEAGAEYLGVVLTPGYGRSVRAAEVAGLFAGTRASRVAVLVDESAASAAEAGRALGAEVLQLHGAEAPETLEVLRTLGGWKLWKGVRARSLDDVDQAVARYGALADGFLVEGWNAGPLGVGGARVALDAARLRALVPARATFVLAGGLTPETVSEAVHTFRPDVVDVSSGVERALGVKDHNKVRGFVAAARAAAADAASVRATR